MSESDEDVLLWAAIEDYAGLWEAVWELRSLHPDWDEAALRDRARSIIEQFLRSDMIQLFRCQEPYGEMVAVEPAAAQSVLADPRCWEPPEFKGISVRFGATDAGATTYNSAR
jgi:hypothetical protein